MQYWYFKDVDTWEGDAYLVIDGEDHYFQFRGEPTLGGALESLFLEGKIKIIKDTGW